MHPQSSRRQAFTLIELLVVMAIIATLMGLLLPAVQKVRESASRTRCMNNLKQLGLGLMHRADTLGSLPAGTEKIGTTTFYNSWALQALTFIEQENLYNLYDRTKNWNDAINQPAVSREVGTFLCPSATSGRVITNSSGQKFAALDYAPMVDIESAAPGNLATNGLLSPWAGDNSGAMSIKSTSRRIIDIKDGTASTLLLVEVAGSPEVWRAGKLVSATGMDMGWATAQVGSPLTQMGVNLDGSTPDGATIGGGTSANCALNCTNGYEPYSMHIQSLNVVFCDGHTATLRSGLPIKTMAALVTRSGGELINSSDF